MEGRDLRMDKASLTRREFARKGILAMAALGSASLMGYGISKSKKLRSLNNALRMGHCAPCVMQTLLEMHDVEHTPMVLYAGALAGGIAGSETECGCLTAPLMFMGYQQKELNSTADKLELIRKSQGYVKEFSAYYDSEICSRIRRDGLVSCIKTMCTFHKPLDRAISGPECMPAEAKESYSRLMAAFTAQEFHCAHTVLDKLQDKLAITRALLDSSWIFIGGLAFLNWTCGALAAGAMALGALTAKLEDSYPRVAKMNWLLMNGDARAMNEEINNFNRSILLSEELGSWFRNEFGFLACHDIWGYDFSKLNDSERYLSGYCMNHCKLMAHKVAQKVRTLV
jgi:hypothetical protein